MSDRPELDYFSDDDSTSETQRNIPQDTNPITPRPPIPRANIPPQPPSQVGMQPPRRRAHKTPGTPPPQRSNARQHRDAGLYLPIWSIALMIFVVLACAFVLVMLVVNLGGNTPEDAQPIVIANSPIPTNLPDSFPASPATATIPPDIDPGVSGAPPQPPVSFHLFGPTLEAIATSTPTPPPLGIGIRVIVTDVEPDELNVRNQPGTRGTEIVFRAEEGTRFTIIGGPQQADGLTWWNIQDTVNTAQTGWAASNYLEVEIGQ